VYTNEPPTNKVWSTVVIRAEFFVKNQKTYMMLFTYNDENALLLKSAFLPGQQRELQNRCLSSFAQGFLSAVERFKQ